MADLQTPLVNKYDWKICALISKQIPAFNKGLSEELVWYTEWPPKDTHSLIPVTYKYVLLCGKRELENVIKVTNLKKGGYSGLPGCIQPNHMSPCEQTFLLLEAEDVRQKERSKRFKGGELSALRLPWKWRRKHDEEYRWPKS